MQPGARATARMRASRAAIARAASGTARASATRYHDRAVPVGVDQVARAHAHAEHLHFGAEGDRLRIRMRWRDARGQELEAGRPLVEVTHGAVR